jgi:5-methylcytosine-specific restriction endonuclease McrA
MPIQTTRLCEKHLDLNGLRYKSGHCVQCMKDTNRKWDKRNIDVVRDNVARRMRKHRSNLAHQTPRWANKNAINVIYRRARELGQTVDHVVPLKGGNVSGLHVENNLQILPRSENSSKGNHFTFQGETTWLSRTQRSRT